MSGSSSTPRAEVSIAVPTYFTEKAISGFTGLITR